MAPLLKLPKFRLIFAACWLLWAALYVQVLQWYHYALPLAIADSFISNVLLVGMCILVSKMFNYYLPGKQRYNYVLAVCIALSLLWLVSSRLLLMFFTEHTAVQGHFFSQSLPIRLVIGFLIIGCMALVSVLWYTLQDKQENERRATEAERLAKEAELYKLRQQLQPHFLFNSLNSINALIGFKPQEARNMIQQLSDFLRGTLKKDETQWVSLEEELQHLQLYLAIEKVRFGHRLSTLIENEESSNNRKLPAMLLQPVVENAIKFGLYDTIDAVTISIHAKAEHDVLVLTVSNPFDPSNAMLKQGTGYGLNSVQRRLYLLYARSDLLQTEAIENLFITTIRIPQK